MTLDEGIKKIKNPTRVVYIGCNDGSGFFFIGNQKEYELYIDLIDNNEHNKIRKKIEKTQNDIELLNERITILQEDIDRYTNDINKLNKEKEPYLKKNKSSDDENAIYKSINEKLEKTEKAKTTSIHDIETAKKRIIKFNELLIQLNQKDQDWIKIRDMVITKKYIHEVDIPGYTFIINGKISGNSWFKHEFDNEIQKILKI